MDSHAPDLPTSTGYRPPAPLETVLPIRGWDAVVISTAETGCLWVTTAYRRFTHTDAVGHTHQMQTPPVHVAALPFHPESFALAAHNEAITLVISRVDEPSAFGSLFADPTPAQAARATANPALHVAH